MIAFTHSIDIHRPIDEVFAFLADFTNIPLWNYYVLDVQQHTPGPVTVGTVYQQVRRHDQQRYHVTVHQFPHSIGVATFPGERPAFDRHLHLEPVGDATTRVQDDWDLETGHPQALQRLAGGRVRDGVAQNLTILKRLLEHGDASLQDGRRTTLPAAATLRS